MRPPWATIALLLALPTATAFAERPNRTLRGIPLACEGDFDVAPVLAKGKTPITPISMLSPGILDDRFIRDLPLEWVVKTTFEVDADGRTRQVRSTATDPPAFARHVNAAVTAWRFRPATRGGAAVPVTCKTSLRFVIVYPG